MSSSRMRHSCDEEFCVTRIGQCQYSVGAEEECLTKSVYNIKVSHATSLFQIRVHLDVSMS
jgi:hypothetical protein